MGHGFGTWLGRFLEAESAEFQPYMPVDFDKLARAMRIGDVLLVEGRARISTAIKYLTQSTWSHAALYVGDMVEGYEGGALIEVTLQGGCNVVPLSKYAKHNTRICRADGLSESERHKVARFMIDRVGYSYDLRNIFDLLRYLLPTPPVPIRFRRRLLAFGSGDPTKAICSSMIAQAFQSVGYPILPDVRTSKSKGNPYSRREVWHIRHHSLYAPRDFDLSPYFDVIKPLTQRGFDPSEIVWSPPEEEAEELPPPEKPSLMARFGVANAWGKMIPNSYRADLH
jgi:hypothetical protein